MQAKTSQVRAALTRCETGYANAGENIRQLSERTEALWFQIDDTVLAMQTAERNGDMAMTMRCLQSLIRYTLAIETEVKRTRRASG